MINEVKALRLSKGWSQEELAKALSVSRQAINAIERDKHDPSLRLAFLLSKLFKKPIEDIFHPASIVRNALSET